MAIPHETPSAAPEQTLPGARKVLFLLLAINLFNYIDRQILSATLSRIKGALFSYDDPLLNFKLGSLTSFFLITYMVMAPVFSRKGDRWNRWWIIGMAVIVWSLASGMSGLAIGYVMLLISRCFVGVGEAAYGPIAPAMLSEYYPVQRRGLIMSIFYMAIPIGSALGFVLGGVIGGLLGWRWAFGVVVFPGVILGLICFMMKDTTRKSPADSGSSSVSWKSIIKELWETKSWRACSLGMTCSTFFLGGVAAFAPLYIFERESRFLLSAQRHQQLVLQTQKQQEEKADERNEAFLNLLNRMESVLSEEEISFEEYQRRIDSLQLSTRERNEFGDRLLDDFLVEGSLRLDRINLYFGGILVISGLFATMSGGWLGDYLRGRIKGAYFHVCGWSALISFPAFLGMLFTPFPAAWLLLFLAIFGLFFNTGPANTILANTSRRAIRANAFALNILIIHALGDAISPMIIGGIADVSSMQTAMIVVSGMILLTGMLWLSGTRTLDADTQKIKQIDEAESAN